VVTEEGAGALTLRLLATPENLRLIRARVRSVTLQLGCTEDESSEIVLAVNEACMNVIQHAYAGRSDGEIVLNIGNNAGRIEVLLEDFAAPVDLSGICPRALDELRPGGLGTHFMRTLMDECCYGHAEDGCGNWLRMVKRLRSQARPVGNAG
jgi:anti-sigma regulatory factor (Ser/Thr protein kinase)